jgi:hypothetical protein
MGSHEVKAKHSTEDMIPRITIRDAEDAGTLKNAVLVYARNVQLDYTQRAGLPGADQFALTVEMNARVEALMTLIRDIDAGTLGDTGPTTQED